jgi:hypothetical protein
MSIIHLSDLLKERDGNSFFIIYLYENVQKLNNMIK